MLNNMKKMKKMAEDEEAIGTTMLLGSGLCGVAGNCAAGFLGIPLLWADIIRDVWLGFLRVWEAMANAGGQ